MHKPLLLTSWKAYEDMETIQQFARAVSQKPTEHVQCAFALPYLILKELSKHQGAHASILLGALSMSPVAENSFTRPVAAKMLKLAGAAFVLVGSDFERHVLGEEDEFSNQKIQAALQEGLLPILCVGESMGEHLAGNGEAIIEMQLKKAFQGLAPQQIEKVAVFFEAPWMSQLPYKPTAEEVSLSYERDHAILGSIVGVEAAAGMQIIHTAPEDLEGFSPPHDKGVFAPHRHFQTVSQLVAQIQALTAEERRVPKEAMQEEAPAVSDLAGAEENAALAEKDALNEEDLAKEPPRAFGEADGEPLDEEALSVSDEEEDDLLDEEAALSVSDIEDGEPLGGEADLSVLDEDDDLLDEEAALSVSDKEDGEPLDEEAALRVSDKEDGVLDKEADLSVLDEEEDVLDEEAALSVSAQEDGEEGTARLEEALPEEEEALPESGLAEDSQVVTGHSTIENEALEEELQQTVAGMAKAVEEVSIFEELPQVIPEKDAPQLLAAPKIEEEGLPTKAPKGHKISDIN